MVLSRRLTKKTTTFVDRSTCLVHFTMLAPLSKLGSWFMNLYYVNMLSNMYYNLIHIVGASHYIEVLKKGCTKSYSITKFNCLTFEFHWTKKTTIIMLLLFMQKHHNKSSNRASRKLPSKQYSSNTPKTHTRATKRDVRNLQSS